MARPKASVNGISASIELIAAKLLLGSGGQVTDRLPHYPQRLPLSYGQKGARRAFSMIHHFAPVLPTRSAIRLDRVAVAE